MIIFFAKDGVLKSKLCKLIFYANFKCFKDYAISISGAKYAHAHHGPVTDNYEYYFATLIHDEKAIRVEEINYREFSHNEKGYNETKVGDIISFDYSNDLQI